MAVPEGAPVRVIAVHKDTSIVRGPDGVDRSAVVSGRFRFEALAPSDYPAVGDWVMIAEGHEPRQDPRSSPPCSPVGPRSSALRPTRAGGRRATWWMSRSSRPTSTSRSWSPGWTATSICDGSSATSPSRGRAASARSIVLNKADVAIDLDRRLLEVESIAPAVPIVVLSALTGDHVADLSAAPRAGPDRGRAGLVGRRQVDARQRAPRGGPSGDQRSPRGRLARPPHDDPPGTVRAAGRRLPHRYAGHARARRSPAPTRASASPSTTSRSWPPHAGSATAGTRASPAARYATRSTTVA